eukprot:gene43634-59094_t
MTEGTQAQLWGDEREVGVEGQGVDVGGAVIVELQTIGLFVMLRRGVSRPLQDLTQAITLVAQGDLTEAFHAIISNQLKEDEITPTLSRWRIANDEAEPETGSDQMKKLKQGCGAKFGDEKRGLRDAMGEA